MEPNKIKEIAERYMQIWSAGNSDLLDKFADSNIYVMYTHFEKPYVGVSDYKDMLNMTYDFFPDLKISVEKIMAGENEATVSWRYTGTHKKGNLFGVDSSNEKISVKGITILEINNDNVIRETGIVDNLSLAKQIGALG